MVIWKKDLGLSYGHGGHLACQGPGVEFVMQSPWRPGSFFLATVFTFLINIIYVNILTNSPE
jgi:hypothetical protein